MKKFLAVLLVALVAVTAVFAADATITLKNTVAGTLPAVTVKYGSEENLLAAVSTKDDVVGNLNEVGGTRYFAVELVGNWANDKNWDITIETEPFMLYDANFTNKLTHINLNYCQKITDESLLYISKTCNQLTHLELYIIPNLTDKGLKEIIINCKEIEHLNLSGCKKFTDRSLMLIPENLKKLKVINLTRCLGVTDEFLIELVKKSAYLGNILQTY